VATDKAVLGQAMTDVVSKVEALGMKKEEPSLWISPPSLLR
jgi:hypothetical protein